MSEIEELTLLLMCLSSWEEKTLSGISSARRCWNRGLDKQPYFS